jgi:hypothetical protein
MLGSFEIWGYKKQEIHETIDEYFRRPVKRPGNTFRLFLKSDSSSI